MTYTDPAEIQPRPETPEWWSKLCELEPAIAGLFEREELALPQGTVTEPHSLITEGR